MQAYHNAMMKNLKPNEVTFGIMIKIYGISRELDKAFELLDLMQAYDITPSIVIYTNLIHNSFYNQSVRRAELAYTLFKKRYPSGGDSLMYSKLINGLMQFRVYKKVPYYLQQTLKDKCTLNDNLIELIKKKMGDYDLRNELEQVE